MRIPSHHYWWLALVVSVLGGTWLRPATACGEESDPLGNAFEVLQTYNWGPARDLLLPIDVAAAASFDNPALRESLETRLLQVLDSTAPQPAKSYVCRQLATMGTRRSIPVLSRLLEDEQLAHMARLALEAIPGEEATAALREAVPRLTGELQAGAIQSLGRRVDVQAVTLLSNLLNSADPQIVTASLAALALIPAGEAERVVADYAPRAPAELRWAAADAALCVARRQLADGRLAEASEILQRWESSAEEQLRCAAVRGLLEAEPEQARARWLAGLADDRESWRRFMAELLHSQGTDEQIQAICDQWSELSEPAQVSLLEALQTRPHPAIRSAAIAAVSSSDPHLRVLGVQALGVSGEAGDVPQLVELSVDADGAVREAVAVSLAALQAHGVDDALLTALDTKDPDQCATIIDALVARRTPGIGPRLLQLARSDAESVQLEALVALQSVADGSMVDALIDVLARSPRGRIRAAAERAVWRSCSRISPASQQAQPLLAALEQADTAEQVALLPALGRVGGAGALAVIEQAMADPDATVRDAAVRGLCNWPEPTVADQLLELARSAKQESHRVWALRGYARVIARLGAEDPEKVSIGLQQAMGLATRLEDQQLILARLTAARCGPSLALAVSMLDDEQLRNDAIDAVVALAEGMKESHPKEARAALEKVLAMTANSDLQLYIQKLLWNMQLKGN